jgi:hypothetical protein
MLSTMVWRMVGTNNDGGISLGVARVTPSEVFVAYIVALVLADGEGLDCDIVRFHADRKHVEQTVG